MFKNLRNILFNFFSSGFEGGYEVDAIRKSILINFFASIGVICLSVFGIIAIKFDRPLFALVLFLFASITLFTIFFLRKTRKVYTAGHIIVILLYALCIFLLFHGGVENTGILWFYALPVVALFIFGKKIGSYYLVSIFMIVALVFAFPPTFAAKYSEVFKIRFLVTFGVSNILTFIYEFIREKTYRSLVDMHDEKTFFTNQVLEQSDKIILQSHKLEEANKELERLSIIASETNNAVVIFDKKGKPEWVNAGFVKLYGFNLEEFIAERGNNLFEMSNTDEVLRIIRNCFDTKKPVQYSCELYKNTGETIWIQTSLTPIVDEKGNLVRVIAIDADISQLKEAEVAINQQKEELQSQGELLLNVNRKLEKSNHILTDSINYAKRIQDAMIPSDEIIREQFAEFFLLFKPKHIVSGDFLWFSNHKKDIYFAVADCTGHGVSGAFMSMMGNTLLNEIVDEKHITNPSEILENLNSGVVYALRRGVAEHEDIQPDGMDISLMKINVKTKEAEISLANQNIIIVQNNKILDIEASIFSIGGDFQENREKSFSNHKVQLAKGDTIYMLSDGFQDQFGGTENKKYSISQLEEFILKNHNLKMEEQKQLFENEFNSWKSTCKQTDDILIFGFKI